jgi:hypothetical protein
MNKSRVWYSLVGFLFGKEIHWPRPVKPLVSPKLSHTIPTRMVGRYTSKKEKSKSKTCYILTGRLESCRTWTRQTKSPDNLNSRRRSQKWDNTNQIGLQRNIQGRVRERLNIPGQSSATENPFWGDVKGYSIWRCLPPVKDPPHRQNESPGIIISNQK